MKRTTITSTLLNLGYLALALQWLWFIILMLPALLDSSLITSLSSEHVSQPRTANDTPSPLSFMFAGMAITFALVIGVYAVYKTPGYAKRHIDSSTKSITKLTLPTVIGHKKISAKKKIILSRRLEFIIRIFLSLLAFIGLLLPLGLSINPLSSDVIFLIGSYLFGWTIFWFAIEYFVNRN